MKLKENLTLKQASLIINADYVGADDFIISGINEIHQVTNGDLTFVDHPKYYEKALNSAATTIIINKKVPCPQGKVLLFSDDPFRDYNILVRKFNSFERCNKNISDSARIGENTVIQPSAFVGNNAVIGKNCIIHSNVSIYDNTVIGDNVIIHANTVLGADAFYFKRRPEGYDKLLSCGKVVIKDNVEIGANCTIDRGVSGDTVIGKGTKLDNLIQIGHDTVIGENCLLGANTKVEDGVELCDNVIVLNNSVLNTYCKIGVGCVVGAGTILSTGVVVKDHVKIGNFVNIGPGAIISENVPDFSTVFGKSLPF